MVLAARRPPGGARVCRGKFRVGTRRAKLRVQLPDAAADRGEAAICRIHAAGASAVAARGGIVVRDRWHPLLLIRYRRDRFIEPAAARRSASMPDIAAAAVNPRFVPAADRALSLGSLRGQGRR